MSLSSNFFFALLPLIKCFSPPFIFFFFLKTIMAAVIPTSSRANWRDRKNKRKIVLLLCLYQRHLMTMLYFSRYVLPSYYYHRDKELWEKMSLQYLISSHTGQHFKGFFRFPKKVLPTVIARLNIPEYVPYISYAIPGDVGFCMMLMR